MTERRWLLLIAAAGIAVFALSFVNAWIVHDREIRGEGYRHAQHFLSAWRGEGMPVLTIAAFGALATALYALILRRRPSLVRLPLLVGAVIVFAIVARFARRPYSLYRKIAVGVLVASLIPDLALLWMPEPAGTIEVILLMITHVIAAGVVVWMLERLTPHP